MRISIMLPIAAIFFALAALPARAGTEETIHAFSVWESHGAFYVPGKEESTFSATLIGRLYVETEKGPIEAGMLSCPATVHIKSADRTQRGSAICAISTKDGGQVFAELTCTGIYMIGCSGEAKITGGTGRFEGVTGSGKFTIRSDLAAANDRQSMGGEMTGGEMMAGQMMAGGPMGAPAGSVGGILFFSELHYKLP